MREIVEVTKKLIQFKTTHDRPEEIKKSVDFVCEYLREAGLGFSTLESNGYTSVLVLPKEGFTPVLLMSHLDVVAAGEELFTPREEDGNLFGRGSIDDKYAVALSLVLVKENLNRLKAKGKGQADLPFGLLITSDEEIGGYYGAEKALEQINCDFCIALDGGNENCIVIKEKGLLTLKLKAKGKAAHGSRPWLGINAIERFYADYLKIKSFFDDQREGSWGKTLCFSQIHAGESFNQVPGECEGILDIRYTENEDPDELYKALQQAIEGELVIERKEPILLGGESPYLDKLLAVAKDAELGFEHGASDARFMTAKGIKGIVWGPNHDLSMHTADEHVQIDSLYRLYGLLDAFMAEIKIAD